MRARHILIGAGALALGIGLATVHPISLPASAGPAATATARPTVTTAPTVATAPTAAPTLSATQVAAIMGPQRKILRMYNGLDAIDKQTHGRLLFSQAELGSSFRDLVGPPQLVVYSKTEWQAFESLGARPDPGRGLSTLTLTINHDASAQKAQSLLPGDVHNAAQADGAGLHHRVYPSDARPGVVYLRLIYELSGYWYAAYDAVFAVGSDRNTLSVLVDIDSPTDNVFGYTGLNAYIDQLTAREQGA